jgi:formylglycine-generating enzyme required for sulfatase activity
MPLPVPKVHLRLPRHFIEGVACTAELRLDNPWQEALDDLSLKLASRDSNIIGSHKVARIDPGKSDFSGVQIQVPDGAAARVIMDVTLQFQFCGMMRNRTSWFFPIQVFSRPEAIQNYNFHVQQAIDNREATHKVLGAAALGDYSPNDGNVIHVHGVNTVGKNDLLTLAYEGMGLVELPPRQDAEVAIDPIAFDNSLGLRLEPVLAGTFTQGSPVSEREEGRDDDEMERGVIFSAPFWMGAHEVSQRAWCEIMGTLKSEHYRGDEMPVHSVTWEEANEFCRLLTAKEHQSHALPAMLEYRLPTEAEWEYACRAGTRGARYGRLEEIAWINQQRLHPMGGKLPNTWNLFDMLGNCFEWCLDSYIEHYPRHGTYTPDPVYHNPDPAVPKIIRGGCFQTGPDFARAAARTKARADRRSRRISFRVVAAFREHNPLTR